jgi:hypothetical protein
MMVGLRQTARLAALSLVVEEQKLVKRLRANGVLEGRFEVYTRAFYRRGGLRKSTDGSPDSHSKPIGSLSRALRRPDHLFAAFASHLPATTCCGLYSNRPALLKDKVGVV